MKRITSSVKEFNESAKKNNLNLIRCWAKFIPSYIFRGSMPYDFFSYEFINKTLEQQKQFITIRDRDQLILKYNEVEYKDKAGFNKEFKSFIQRKWILVNKENYKEFINFLKQNGNKYISKPIDGSKGEGIELIEIHKNTDLGKIYENNVNKIVEEYILQHDELSDWNIDSVNTIRIITTYIENELKIIGTGIRVGQKGSFLDNISQGGGAAYIDYETGIVRTPLINKDTNNIVTKEIKGFKIPNWNKVKEIIPEIVKIDDKCKVIGWDFAITEKGVELIEANTCPGLTIAQGLDYGGKRYLVEEYI